MGVITNYNSFRGHLMKFSDAGKFLGVHFRWGRLRPCPSHGTYSEVVLKNNPYPES